MENKNKKEEKQLNSNLNTFLKSKGKECKNPEECEINTKDGLIEVVDKKYVTNDGRQLLM